MLSPQRRREIIDALRRGTVPRRALDAFAVGLDRFEEAIAAELQLVSTGGSVFKAVRGEYGSGKTFFSRWIQEQARKSKFATSEVQISETETPLHRLETVYRRLVERLSTSDVEQGALRSIIDGWLYTLDEDVLATGGVNDEAVLLARTEELLEQRLTVVSKLAPSFAMALRSYRRAVAKGDRSSADGIISWLSGEPNVAASVKREAGIKGDIDHFGALSFLQGLLVVLRDSGFAGLVVVLDEVETLQRVRGDVREKALNALRQLIDEVDAGRFPGLYLLITGTPAFFDSPQGAQRLPPLAQRLHVDFQTGARFDNPRAVQIRLSNFSQELLVDVGRRVRDIYADGSTCTERIRGSADDQYLQSLAQAVTGKLGGKVGIAPRIFLKKLVGDVLDRLEQFPDFDPTQHYALTLEQNEMSETERAAVENDVDTIKLNL